MDAFIVFGLVLLCGLATTRSKETTVLLGAGGMRDGVEGLESQHERVGAVLAESLRLHSYVQLMGQRQAWETQPHLLALAQRDPQILHSTIIRDSQRFVVVIG